QHRFIALELRSLDGVASDRQRLHERKLLEGERVGSVQLVRGNENALAHAAVDVYAEDLEIDTAVAFAAAAGDAAAAIEIRLDGAAVAGAQIGARIIHLVDLDAELVAE